MTTNQSIILDRIVSAKFIPVLTLDNSEEAVSLAMAILSGGLSIIEVAFRSCAAEESIKDLRERVPEILVGAGTVSSVDQVQSALQADAQFIVTPGFNPLVVEASLIAGIPIFPGINNPTGVEQILNYGLSAAKFFPAEASGGLPFLRTMLGPYPSTRFIPSGGITANNLRSYLALPNVIACSGSWIADPVLIRERNFKEIERRVSEVVVLINQSE